MKTLFMLMASHNGQVAIPLQEIAETYFGIKDKAVLSQKARTAQLPIPTFRLEKSQKAPWLVHATDLANYIDQQQQIAKKDWQQMNS